jgi:uncharacterized protein YchJ
MLKQLLRWFAGGEKVDYADIGRNDSCPCGSGEKFKNCCYDEHQKRRRAHRDAKLFGSPKG